MGRDIFHHPRVFQALSSLALDISRDGAATVSFLPVPGGVTESPELLQVVVLSRCPEHCRGPGRFLAPSILVPWVEFASVPSAPRLMGHKPTWSMAEPRGGGREEEK